MLKKIMGSLSRVLIILVGALLTCAVGYGVFWGLDWIAVKVMSFLTNAFNYMTGNPTVCVIILVAFVICATAFDMIATLIYTKIKTKIKTKKANKNP